MKKLVYLALIFFPISLCAQVNHWETVVFAEDDWQYLLPEEEPPANWTSLGFMTNQDWNTGPGGFGYGDEDDQTILPPTISCYQRHIFNITDKSLLRQAMLQFDYDDAIVIYLNGQEVVRRNITSGGAPAFDQPANGVGEALLYQGLAAERYFLGGDKLNDLLQEGENVLAVQTHNADLGSTDFSSRVWLHLGISNNRRDYDPVPSAVFLLPELSSSNLPLMVIETDELIPNEPKITGRLAIIHHGTENRNYLGDSGNEYEGLVGIEIRGSSSADLFPKKSYSFETRDAAGENRNVSLFDMPEENDWVLHGPYSDKSLLRNMLTLHIGRSMGHWAPRTQACELVINGDYRGFYVFMEKIKRDKGRVAIAKLREEDISGDELTGGYILKIDKQTGGDALAWSSPFPPLSGAGQTIDYLLHYPKLPDIQPQQLDYIRQYVTDFETALFGEKPNDPASGYKNYIDVPSFVDYILATELCKNIDGYRLSTFLYKQKDSDGGKLFAGPLWDYNLAWGNVNYCEAQVTSGWELDFNSVCSGDFWLNPPFWPKMVTADTSFSNAMQCRWDELRQGALHQDSLFAFIDEQTALFDEAQARNFDRWPVLGEAIWPNFFVGNTYASEIDYLKQFITARLDFMDRFMFGVCNGGNLTDGAFSIKVFPNPSYGTLYFECIGIGEGQEMRFYNSLGQLIYLQPIITTRFEIPTHLLTSGMYYYTIGDGQNLLEQGKVVVN